MFKSLIYNILSFNLVLSDFSLFKIIVYDTFFDTRYLYRRSGGPSCSNYDGLNEPGHVLFQDGHGNWKLSNQFTIEHNENDPFCDIISNKYSIPTFKFKDIVLCNITEGFEVVGSTFMTTLAAKDCINKFQEMLRESKPDEYVFMSTKKVWVSGWPKTNCKFAYSGEARIRQSGLAKLSVYHKNCIEDIMNEENDTKAGANENNTMIFLLIGLSAVVLLCVPTFITLFCLKRREKLCFKKENQEIIVNQNELYGNLSNQDYFSERYDTDIVDRNQYYEEEYEA